MKVDGSYHCGQIITTAEVDPSTPIVCHYTDYQILGGGPSMIIHRVKYLGWFCIDYPKWGGYDPILGIQICEENSKSGINSRSAGCCLSEYCFSYN